DQGAGGLVGQGGDELDEGVGDLRPCPAGQVGVAQPDGAWVAALLEEVGQEQPVVLVAVVRGIRRQHRLLVHRSPYSRSHTTISPCGDAAAAVRPSGAAATLLMGPTFQSRQATCLPVGMAHRRTVPSPLPESSRPSGVKVMPQTV